MPSPMPVPPPFPSRAPPAALLRTLVRAAGLGSTRALTALNRTVEPVLRRRAQQLACGRCPAHGAVDRAIARAAARLPTAARLEAAHDAVSDVLAIMAAPLRGTRRTRWSAIEEGRPVMPYLAGVLRFRLEKHLAAHAADLARAADTVPLAPGGDGPGLEVADRALAPDGAAPLRAALRRVLPAIARLPGRQRLAILAEIDLAAARAAGLEADADPDALAQARHHARAKLRALLAPWPELLEGLR